MYILRVDSCECIQAPAFPFPGQVADTRVERITAGSVRFIHVLSHLRRYYLLTVARNYVRLPCRVYDTRWRAVYGFRCLPRNSYADTRKTITSRPSSYARRDVQRNVVAAEKRREKERGNEGEIERERSVTGIAGIASLKKERGNGDVVAKETTSRNHTVVAEERFKNE